jgi:PKD repeat protein
MLAGCHVSGSGLGMDAGRDGGVPDASTPLTIDIAVTGCASYDAASIACSGHAPLTLAFAPVGSPALTTYLWRFGDGSAPVADRAPSHTYALPGRYDVSVTGQGPTVGAVSQTRAGLVVVQSIGAGGPCDVDAQCASGLACACKRGSGCDPAFVRGFCSTPCPTGFCGDEVVPGHADAVCAGYTVPAPAPRGATDAGAASDAGTPTWSPVCLANCADGAPCPAGFTCRQLHAAGAGTAGWVQACLPAGVAGDLGASCRNASGLLDNSRCASGYCAPLGTNGLCSASCQSPLTCPDGAACARFGAAQLCVATCSATVPCAGDPSIACLSGTPPDASTDGGLAIVSGDLNQTYCAPR